MLIIKSNKATIKNFTIFAERHSGTKFLTQYISTNYQSDDKGFSGLPVTWDYGWKHWMGLNDEKIKSQGSSTLFISIVRDPYNWLQAMYRMPHHLRKWDGRMDHNPFFNMRDFLESEIESYHHGKELTEDFHIYKKRRYVNIFELRETKNRYLIDIMPQLAQNYILINYEILHNNFTDFIKSINYNFNIKLKRFVPNNANKKDYSIVDKENIDFINSNLNWDTEHFLGYQKRI